MVLSVVIGAHVAFAIGLIAASAVKYVPQLREMLDAKLIKHEEEPPPKEPPPPPPDFKPPPIQTPSLDLPVVAGPPSERAVVVPKAEPPPPAAKPAPPPITQARVAKGSNLGEACSSYYPSASRRLSEEGTTFKEVLDNLREELACEHLRQNNVSIQDLSSMLGFSDASTFSRAFKRWTGRRPSITRSAISTRNN